MILYIMSRLKLKMFFVFLILIPLSIAVNDTCGDGICSPNDLNWNCEKDCRYCGDEICTMWDMEDLCVEDCAECGDNKCFYTEAKSCPRDCDLSAPNTIGTISFPMNEKYSLDETYSIEAIDLIGYDEREENNYTYYVSFNFYKNNALLKSAEIKTQSYYETEEIPYLFYVYGNYLAKDIASMMVNRVKPMNETLILKAGEGFFCDDEFFLHAATYNPDGTTTSLMKLVKSEFKRGTTPCSKIINVTKRNAMIIP